MSHGVKNFAWRDGRPRWVCGRNLRARGFKGKDLKDQYGNWLPLALALQAAHELNVEAGITSEPPDFASMADHDHHLAVRSGFVYFVICGERVKIGFSRNPVARIDAMKTSMPEAISMIVAVPGTDRDERRLHTKFASLSAERRMVRDVSADPECHDPLY